MIQARNEGQITIFCIWKASCRDNLGYIVGNPLGTFTAVLLGQKAKRGVGAVHTECMLGCWWPFFQKDICMNVGAELLCLVHHHSKEIDDMVLDLFDRFYFW